MDKNYEFEMRTIDRVDKVLKELQNITLNHGIEESRFKATKDNLGLVRKVHLGKLILAEGQNGKIKSKLKFSSFLPPVPIEPFKPDDNSRTNNENVMTKKSKRK